MKPIILSVAGLLLLPSCTTPSGADGSTADGIAISAFFVLMAPIAIVQYTGEALVDGTKAHIYAKPGVTLTSYEASIREAEHLEKGFIPWEISREDDGTQRYKARLGWKIYFGRFKEDVAIDYRG